VCRSTGASGSVRPSGASVVGTDRLDRPVILFESEWELHYFERHHPDVPLLAESPAVIRDKR